MKIFAVFNSQKSHINYVKDLTATGHIIIGL